MRAVPTRPVDPVTAIFIQRLRSAVAIEGDLVAFAVARLEADRLVAQRPRVLLAESLEHLAAAPEEALRLAQLSASQSVGGQERERNRRVRVADDGARERIAPVRAGRPSPAGSVVSVPAGSV